MKKAEIRRVYKKKRADLDSQTRQINDQYILKQFTNLTIPPVVFLHRYLPVLDQYEIPNEHIVGHLKMINPSLIQAVPYMSGDEMLASLYNDHIHLKKNRWGIEEPEKPIAVDIQKIDCVIVPLLAFDMNGNRVGYGKGCYDRFLASCRPGVLKIGISYFDPLNKITDTDEFDIPLNLCITPQKVYEFG